MSVAQRPARFVIVGLANTAITLGAYATLLSLDISYLLALVPSFALGTLNGYLLNRAWTFGARQLPHRRVARYAAVQTSTLALNAVLLAALVDGFDTARLLAQVVVFPVVAAGSFVANRGWVFAQT